MRRFWIAARRFVHRLRFRQRPTIWIDGHLGVEEVAIRGVIGLNLDCRALDRNARFLVSSHQALDSREFWHQWRARHPDPIYVCEDGHIFRYRPWLTE